MSDPKIEASETRILVTGGDGQFARALRHYLPDAAYAGRAWIDVGDPLTVDKIKALRPRIIIHAGAITDHQCAGAAALIRTNVLGTAHVAQAASEITARLVYLSTHYVYPGEYGDHGEDDRCRPIGAYAWSKYAGERYAGVVYRSLIVRGSWYTPEKVRGWKAHLTDAYTNREPVLIAAGKVVALIAARATGIVNIGGERRTFAEIAEAEHCPVSPITRAQFDAAHLAPYPFPEDSSVDTSRYRAIVGA